MKRNYHTINKQGKANERKLADFHTWPASDPTALTRGAESGDDRKLAISP